MRIFFGRHVFFLGVFLLGAWESVASTIDRERLAKLNYVFNYHKGEKSSQYVGLKEKQKQVIINRALDVMKRLPRQFPLPDTAPLTQAFEELSVRREARASVKERTRRKEGSGLDLKGLFGAMSSNYTQGRVYQDQAAGYYTGGGFSMRTRSGSCKPFSVTPGHLKGSCEGIDFFLGGFSMISGDKAIEILKNIGSQAASYGFQLALKTYCPQIEMLLSKMRDLAAAAGAASLEDCRMAQSLVAAAAPKDSLLYEKICQDIEGQSGMDYMNARENCGEEKAKKKAREIQKQSKETVLLDNFNLFIMGAGKARVPKEVQESMMSVCGTIVVTDGKAETYPSLVDGDRGFNAFLKGGEEAEMYRCDGGKCLSPTKEKIQIPKEDSYKNRTEERGHSIRDKMIGNKALDPDDLDFISSWGESYPIFRYIQLEVVTGANILGGVNEILATHMVLHYMKSAVVQMRAVVETLLPEQLNQEHFKNYIADLRIVQSQIEEKYQAVHKLAWQMEQRAKDISTFNRAKIR